MSMQDHIRKIMRSVGVSLRDESLDDTFIGLNIGERNSGAPVNTEHHGYRFFTRPYLNLDESNCMVDRRLSMLLNPNPQSIERKIRAYLDPELHRSEGQSWCPGVDVHNPFIPLLSNNLVSLTGWEDFTLNMNTTTPGVYRDVMSMPDDVPYQYGTYDLQATFRNIEGDPITLLHYMWLLYMGLNKEGRIMPYPELLLLNEFDANFRIYTLVMDKTQTFVTRLAAPGAAIMVNAPTGQILNKTGDHAESPFQVANEQLNFSYRCMGLTQYDHMLVYEFNDLVETFNPTMGDGKRGYETVKLKPIEKRWFTRRAYPYINPVNMELEWHVMRSYYNANIGMFQKVLEETQRT